ncbi:MAG: bacteriocin [Legionella sp.]|nr:bacteriocin [Legionella sp.]
METNQERSRPLAYTLAKELNINELEAISGGELRATTQRQCLRPTGNIGCMDAEIDITIDW